MNKMFSGKVESVHEHNYPLTAEEILEITMKEYLFTISTIYTSMSEDDIGEIKQNKSYEDETSDGAWTQAKDDLKIIRPATTPVEIQSIHIRFLGMLDK